MSYDRMRENLQQARCACGKGIVVRTYYCEMNDWNQTREGYEGQVIQCEDCKAKYHIESTSRIYNRPSWEGNNIVTDYFLVPIGKTLHPACKPARHFSYRFNDTCVADYPIETLKAVINDMDKNKYNTRLKLDASREIVGRYYRSYKKKSLPAIKDILQECVENYDSFEWTYDKMQEYKKEQQKEIDENNRIIKEVLAESYPLEFK